MKNSIKFMKISIWLGLRSINPIWFFDLSGNVFKNVDKIPNYVYFAVMYDYIHKKIIPAFEFEINIHTESKININLSRVKDIYDDQVAPFIFVDQRRQSINAITSALPVHIKYIFLR